MWHELVLNGIGGCTIADAKDRVSYDEFREWVSYRALRGSFNQGLRSDRGAALIADVNLRTSIKNPTHKIYDLLPYEDEPPISLENAMEKWN